MSAISEDAVSTSVVQEGPSRENTVASRRVLELLAPGLMLIVSIAVVLLGVLSIVRMDMESYVLPALAALSVVLQFLFLDAYRQHKAFDYRIAVLALVTFVFLFIYTLLPEYVTGLQLNAIFHRSLFAAFFLITTGTPAMSLSLLYLLKARPSASDVAVYPLILMPVVLVISLYFVMIYKIVQLGVATFSWEILTQPMMYHGVPVRTFIAGDWPSWETQVLQQSGMLNHLLGTGLLILLTTIISVPIGAGAGIYLSEYGETRFGNFARFSISSLRAISLLILALSAYSLVKMASDTPLEPFISGTYFTGWEERTSRGGSYLTASLVLSLLIIPVITRATEEGCRSVPIELREGSLALGATEGRTLGKIVLPWAFPNIVTSWLLGCAEAAGSVAVLLFIAYTGEYGVGIFRQVTSLGFFLFNSNFDLPGITGLFRPYQFMAAFLLLCLTLGLGVLAMIVKWWLVRRYRGG